MKKYNIKRRLKSLGKRARKRSVIKARERRMYGRNYVSPVKIAEILAISLFVMIFVTRASGLFEDTVVDINLIVQDAEMYVGEKKPEFVTEIICDGDVAVVLDEEMEYTIQHLIDELNHGTGYTIESESDGTEVGNYPIYAELTTAVSTPLNTDWFDKVRINTVAGNLKVKEIDEEYLASVEARKNRPMIALTFDDGPGKYTMRLLDALEEKNAQATFFMLGQNVFKYKAEVEKMKEIGCELGNHSYSHANLATLSAGKISSEINDTNTLIEEIVGEPASMLRPPYGSINATLKENAGMPMVLWSIDTLDWKSRNAQAVIDHVLANVSDGDIVLMHDIYSSTIDAAIELIDILQEQGYCLVTVSELAESRGYELVNGEKYYGFYNE